MALKGTACLPHSDVVLAGLIHIVHLHDDGEDGVGTGGRFVHRCSADRAHLLPLIHEAIDPFLVAHDRLRQALHHGNDTTSLAFAGAWLGLGSVRLFLIGSKADCGCTRGVAHLPPHCYGKKSWMSRRPKLVADASLRPLTCRIAWLYRPTDGPHVEIFATRSQNLRRLARKQLSA